MQQHISTTPTLIPLAIPISILMAQQCTTYSENAVEIRTIQSTADAADDAPPVIIKKQTIAERVAEQRVSHFLMALALLGTMTGPLLSVLALMPRAIFSGVFFIVGWGSIANNGIVTKLLYLLREPRFRQPYDPLNRVPKSQIWHFVGWQLLGWASTVAISQTLGAIGFPVLICALIPLRWAIFPKLFTVQELEIMDHLTATGEMVMVSLGGRPEMREKKLERLRNQRDEERVIEGREERGMEEGGERMEGGGVWSGAVEGPVRQVEEKEEIRARDERPVGEGATRLRRQGANGGNESEDSDRTRIE